jgi:hypothetical protein
VLRLADLLAEEPFALELLSGGPSAAAREVRGAHRLARAEQVLGRSLKQPSTIAAIHIVLVAEAGAQSAGASLDGSRLPARAARP